MPAGSGASIASGFDPLNSSLSNPLQQHGSGAASVTGGGIAGTEPTMRAVQMENIALKAEISRLQEALELRQSTYARKEGRLQREIAALKEQLDSAVLARTQSQDHMKLLKDMNSFIQTGIHTMQDRTRDLMTAHEDELRRSFRAQLHEVERRLAEEKQRHMDGAASYLEQIAALRSELSWMKDEATRLDQANQKFREEASKCRVALRAQEDDRNILVKQVAVLKMENARLRDELGSRILAGSATEPAVAAAAGAVPSSTSTMLSGDVDAQLQLQLQRTASGIASSPVFGAAVEDYSASSPPAVGSAAFPGAGAGTGFSQAIAPSSSSPRSKQQQQLLSPGGGSGTSAARNPERFQEALKRLQRLLESERAQLKQQRAAYVAVLAERTELEGFLRECVEDVRSQLNDSAKLGDMTVQDRQAVLEMLLNKERVLALLYEKTFPGKKHLITRHPQGMATATVAGTAAGGRMAVGDGQLGSSAGPGNASPPPGHVLFGEGNARRFKEQMEAQQQQHPVIGKLRSFMNDDDDGQGDDDHGDRAAWSSSSK